MRLFVAIDLGEDIRERIRQFVEQIRGFAPDARWTSPESVHVTLKFIGETSVESGNEIKALLSRICAVPFDMAFRGYGFFPSAMAARVFWLGVDAGTPLSDLASAIDDSLSGVGIPKETLAFRPHVTLARGARPSKEGHCFLRLQQHLSTVAPSDFGSMTTRDFFLFESHMEKGRSRYTKIAHFNLGE